jgi:hypothetical protein
VAGDEPEPLPGCGFDQLNVVVAEMGMLISDTQTPAGGELQVVNNSNSASGAVVSKPRPNHIGYFYPPNMGVRGPRLAQMASWPLQRTPVGKHRNRSLERAQVCRPVRIFQHDHWSRSTIESINRSDASSLTIQESNGSA